MNNEVNSVTEKEILTLLNKYKSGELDAEVAVQALAKAPFEDMKFAAVDHAREMRQGFPEVIYGEGKTAEQILAIMQSLAEHSEGSIMATRASREKYDYVHAALAETEYNEAARIIYIDRRNTAVDEEHRILILTAGTSDIPVAEEARVTAELWGNSVVTHYDCGVAGIHRLFAHIEDIRSANVIIVIAGMEGALASVVGGLTDKPIIAVPTSVGYGAAFGGVAALLSMLNSCASGVSVVNIDNGFGAGVLASKINHLR